jgi:hypothetical protein
MRVVIGLGVSLLSLGAMAFAFNFLGSRTVGVTLGTFGAKK